MSHVLQAGHKLMLSVAKQSAGVKGLRTVPVALKESCTQSGFEGLRNCFMWDDKHGFGYNKDGELVIVKPDTETSQMLSSGTSDSLRFVKDIASEFKEEVLESDDENFPASGGSKFSPNKAQSP